MTQIADCALKIQVSELLSEASEYTPERLLFEVKKRVNSDQRIKSDVVVFLHHFIDSKLIDQLVDNELKAVFAFILQREDYYRAFETTLLSSRH